MKNPLHNPLPASLSSECKKAAAILESFINPKLKIDGQIPHKIFVGAKGIAVFTALRVGFLGSIRFGSGLIVARLPDGSWSAPSAMAMGGLGAGGQFGAELTDFVFVLTTDAAVKTFMQSGNLTLGGNISMAVGPIGRSAEAGGVVGTKGATGVFAYSKTRGLYGGLTVEGGVLAERADANKKLYGRKIRAKELLSGSIPPPPEAGVLIELLNGDFFRVEGPAESTPEGSELPHEQNTEASAQPADAQPQGVSVPAPDHLAAVGPNTEQTPRATEPAPERLEQPREQITEASAQTPGGQSQGVLAAAPDQLAVAEPSAEKTPGAAESLTRESHSMCHELDSQDATPAAESKPTTELSAKKATGDVEVSNNVTHDVHTSNAQEPMPTTEIVPAVEPSTQSVTKGNEPAAEDTHDTSRELGVSRPISATERPSDSIETAPSASR
ncbi:hypothetical protein N7472_004490 [Penicillium cf. griseofulvum]|uniref:Ysc84 actin-binding domain-containing protein n=1 Tax=Penicillium cf. griseofulvum TaxID=2972120 RepID=A0A9W9MDM7_9EURO|nr:hypothetical protein N7472_004490 [Penicillium cf. griseofulvum]